jgi:hypothetical protein
MIAARTQGNTIMRLNPHDDSPRLERIFRPITRIARSKPDRAKPRGKRPWREHRKRHYYASVM